MNESIVAGISISLGLMGIIYLFAIRLNEIKAILNKQEDIKNKVFILRIEPHIVSNGQDQPKYGIGFNIYFANCTSKIINIAFDPTRTKISANGMMRPTTKYPEKLLLPYEYNIHNGVRTYYLEYEKVKNEEDKVEIHINVALKYSINNSVTNEYEALYTYTAECILSETTEGHPRINITSFELKNGLL